MALFTRFILSSVLSFVALALPAGAQEPGVGAGSISVVWRQAVPFTTRPLLVDRGRLFVFSGGNASALDASTGAVMWNYAGPTISEIAQQLGCACQNAAGPAGNGLYSVGGGDTLTALDPLTGAARWSRIVGEAIASPSVAADGLVMLASGDQQGFSIYALEDADGARRWEVRLRERPLPGLLAWRGLVFAPLSDGTLLAIEAPTGRPVWREMVGDLPEPLAPTQIGNDGTLVLRTQSAVLALDAATGTRRWELAAPEFPPRPLVADDRVYLASGTGAISAVEASSGAVVWSRELGVLPGSEGLSRLAGSLYVTSFDGALIALDPATGAQRWTREVGRTIAPPSLGAGGLHVGTLAGDVYVLEPNTGAVQFQLSLGGAILFSPVSVGDAVYVATDTEDGTTVLAVHGPD